MSTQVKRSSTSQHPPVEQKRSSVFRSIPEHGSFSKPPGKGLHVPVTSKTRAMTPVAQIVLCIIGSAISVAICVWLFIFSNDLGWRRLLFAGGAALCALMFALLAFSSIRKANHPAEPEPLPDIDRRRSTICAASRGARSISVTGHHDDPTQVLVTGDKGRPLH